MEKLDKSGRPRLLRVEGKRVLFYPTPADTLVREVQNHKLDCRQLRNATLSTKTQLVVSFPGLLQVTHSNDQEPFAYQHMLYPQQKDYVKTPNSSSLP